METQTTLGSKRTELFVGLDHSPELVHYLGLSAAFSKFIHPMLLASRLMRFYSALSSDILVTDYRCSSLATMGKR